MENQRIRFSSNEMGMSKLIIFFMVVFKFMEVVHIQLFII